MHWLANIAVCTPFIKLKRFFFFSSRNSSFSNLISLYVHAVCRLNCLRFDHSSLLGVPPHNHGVSLYVWLTMWWLCLIKGSKDGLCPLEKLEAVRKKMKCVNGLHVIDGGDHSFKIGKKHLQSEGTTQEEAEETAVQAIARFTSRFMGGTWHLSTALVCSSFSNAKVSLVILYISYWPFFLSFVCVCVFFGGGGWLATFGAGFSTCVL